MNLQPVLILDETVTARRDARPPGGGSPPDMALARALDRLRPVALEEMRELALLRRTDVKYLIPRGALPGLLAAARDAYRVLEVDGLRLQRYETLYFDTPALDLYLLHHNRARRRFKVRSRRYLESDLSFLEVKLKDRGDRTVKVRRRTDNLVTALSAASLRFVESATGDPGVALETLSPTLWNAFSRIALASPQYGERVTLDLSVLLCRGAQTVQLHDWAIVEVKSASASRNSPILLQLRALGVRPTGFSKYCIGVAALWPEIKHNRFIRKLRLITPDDKEHYRVD